MKGWSEEWKGGNRKALVRWATKRFAIRWATLFSNPIFQRSSQVQEWRQKREMLKGNLSLQSGFDLLDVVRLTRISSSTTGHLVNICFICIGNSRLRPRLKPKVVVPMHFWYNTNVLERFTSGPYRTKLLDSNKFTVNKDTLPVGPEIYVLKVVREVDL